MFEADILTISQCPGLVSSVTFSHLHAPKLLSGLLVKSINVMDIIAAETRVSEVDILT